MSPTEKPSTLQNLIDREYISRLPNLYCHFVRARNVDAIVDLFDENCQILVRADAAWAGEFSGKAAIGKMLRDGLAQNGPWPLTHNHVITLVDDDSATGLVHVQVRMDAVGLKVASVGTYEDEYVRLGSGIWKFRSRIYTSVTLAPELQIAGSAPARATSSPAG